MELYPFQKKIQAWMMSTDPRVSHKPHKILAVDMGGGKTPITCDTIRALGLSNGLILCPPKIKDTWAERLVEWGACKPSDIFICRSTKDTVPPSARFVIANYELMRSANKQRRKKTDPEDMVMRKKANPLFKQVYTREWHVLVLDEVHKLQSNNSAITFAILKRNGYPLAGRAHHIWGLSGTILDRAINLFPIGKALGPELLGKYTDLDEYGMRFCAGYQDEYGNGVYKGTSNEEELAEMFSPIMKVVRRQDFMSEIPNVIEDEVIFEDVGPLSADITTDYAATVYKAVGLGKMKFVVEYIKETYSDNSERFMICAHHRDVISYLHKALESFGVSRIYGGMSDNAVQREINEFVHGSNRVLIINETAGGEGIDGLQFRCNRLIFCENDWTEKMRAQVIGRLDRLGQTKAVYVTSFRAKRTFDVNIIGTQKSKKFHANKFLNLVRGYTNMSVDKFLETVAAGVTSMAESLKTIAAGGVAATASGSAKVETKTEAKADKPKADKPKAETKEAKTTEDEVRAGAAKLIAEAKKAGATQKEAEEFVKNINAEHGADAEKKTIVSVPKENYAALLAAYGEAVFEKEEVGEV